MTVNSMNDLKTFGIRETTFKNAQIDAGALFAFDAVDFPGSPENWDLIGATRGGSTWNYDPTWREIEVDNAPGPIKGSQRVTREVVTLSVNLVEATVDNFLKMFPTAVQGDDVPTGDATHKAIVFEKGLCNAIEDGDYIEGLALIAKRKGDGKKYVWWIKNALNVEGVEVNTEYQDETVFSVTFTAHFDPADLETRPFGIYVPFPTGSISGIVTDNGTGEPISGATVSVENTTLEADTNDQGYYRIDGLTEGDYDLVASATGYDDKTEAAVSVVPYQVTELDFALTETI